MHDTGYKTNPKSEARNPKQIQNSNFKCSKPWRGILSPAPVILNEVKNQFFFYASKNQILRCTQDEKLSVGKAFSGCYPIDQ